MKKGSLFFALLLVFCSFMACVEQQNFDQYEDLSVTPVVEAALLYFETPEDVINQGPSPSFYTTTFDFEAFREQYVADRLLEGVLVYQLENTTSKPLRLSIEFLDATGTVLDTETFAMDPAPTAVLNREVAYGPGGKSLDILRNVASLRISATNLGDTTSVSTAPEPRFILRSSAQFRIRLK